MDLLLSAADAALIHAHAKLSPELKRTLGAGLVEGQFLRYSLHDSQIAELFAAVALAHTQAQDRRRRRELKRITAKLAEKSHQAGLGLEQLNRAMDQAQNAWNRSRQPDLGGFTPDQLHILLSGDWSPRSPGLRLADVAPVESLQNSRTLHNARTMLRALAEDGGAKATTAGNLNRAFVARMLETMRFPDRYLDELRSYNKVINEQDARPVHETRVLLELTDLVHVRKGRFVTRPLGRDLLRDDRTGELFSRLVRTTFRVFNLSYGDRLPELEDFQRIIAYPLAILARKPAGWHPFPELVRELIHPMLAVQLPEPARIHLGEALVRSRLLGRLEALGMVEVRREKDPRSHYLDRWTQVRKTELFGAVFSLEI